jgi:hypothetical protein
MDETPSPSSLPAGERDGVRGNFIDCNEIHNVHIRTDSYSIQGLGTGLL